MIKNIEILLIFLPLAVLADCVDSDKSRTDRLASSISDYTKPTGDLIITTGHVRFDTLPENLSTHFLEPGANRVFIYQRTGVTVTDPMDWEAKYTETLIFQIDSSMKEFKYCDRDLALVDCKYYWICAAREVMKEIKDVRKGCISINITRDSIRIDIDIDPEFAFGGFMEASADKLIKYRTVKRL